MKYAEVYKGLGYTVEVLGTDSGSYGWSVQLDGEMDTATHVNELSTEQAALEAGTAWAKGAIDKHSKRR